MADKVAVKAPETAPAKADDGLLKSVMNAKKRAKTAGYDVVGFGQSLLRHDPTVQVDDDADAAAQDQVYDLIDQQETLISIVNDFMMNILRTKADQVTGKAVKQDTADNPLDRAYIKAQKGISVMIQRISNLGFPPELIDEGIFAMKALNALHPDPDARARGVKQFQVAAQAKIDAAKAAKDEAQKADADADDPASS